MHARPDPLDGEVCDFNTPLTLAYIETLIGAEVVDSVMLADRVHVMIVDDLGHEKGLPLNRAVTALYWERCGDPNDHCIVGDVVIVPNRDFAPADMGVDRS
ncbi:hypothetical protein QF000_001711 [Paraburkholderia atlantica]|uniref:DUF3846 domain-containing protein n=1 Tax=Paraburkholderia atlantica TaxID=2654982 RepID=UPI003D1F2E26